MKDARIKRSDIILVAGAICVTLTSPLILCVLFAIDLQMFAITLFLSGWVEASGSDHFRHCAHTATRSSQAKSVTNRTKIIKKSKGVGVKQINCNRPYIPAPVDRTIS